MVGIDTNVLVRLLIEDDAEQTQHARTLVERTVTRGEGVLVSLLVLMETEWVLRSRYALDKATSIGTFRALLETHEIVFEDEPSVEQALFDWADNSAGFADCLIAAHNLRLGCTATATFDARASQLPGFVRA